MKKHYIVAGLLFFAQGFLLYGMMSQPEEESVLLEQEVVAEQKEMASRLNGLLANEYLVYTKSWKFHWNVEGKHFGAMHDFFGKQREQLGDIVDSVAERVRALDVMADGTLVEFAQKSVLTEQPGNNPDDLEMVRLLLQDHEMIIQQIKDDSVFANEIGDYGTNNFLCDLLVKHEKMAWMLRSFLKK